MLYSVIVTYEKCPKSVFGLLYKSSLCNRCGGKQTLLQAISLNLFAHWFVDEDDSLFSFSLTFIAALPGCHAHKDANRGQRVRER